MEREHKRLTFYGGDLGALMPFGLFLAGVAWLGLAGAPDERGFWPILLGAFALGVVLAKDRAAYAESFLRGMGQTIVMKMVVAWILAGVLGTLIGASGLVATLTHLAQEAGLHGGGFVAAAFVVACVVATATGTSLGTILVCAPVLYPGGAALQADPAMLIGAILGGATFGDNISPVSDTTIASATTQGAAMGDVVRSRMIYALPAAGLALIVFAIWGGASVAPSASEHVAAKRGGLVPLAMLFAPLLSIVLLIRGRHLVEGLLAGCLAATLVALACGLIEPQQLFFLDRDNFSARGLYLEGMERAVGVSIFTLLLMGLVTPIEDTGLLARRLRGSQARIRSAKSAEMWIFATVSGAVLLTTHSVVAILATGKLAADVGTRFGIAPAQRANILDVTVCTYPFLLPFFIPTILAASATASGAATGMPRISPLVAGLHNAHSWALLAVLLSVILLRRRPNC